MCIQTEIKAVLEYVYLRIQKVSRICILPDFRIVFLASFRGLRYNYNLRSDDATRTSAHLVVSIWSYWMDTGEGGGNEYGRSNHLEKRKSFPWSKDVVCG